MKKLIFTLSLISGFTVTSAQLYTPSKISKQQKDNLSIIIKKSEKDKIDWNYTKQYFSDFKNKDSIQISVKIIQEKSGKVKSQKKYTAKGIKQNLEDLLSQLKKMIIE